MALAGPLGAGKTTLVRSIVEASRGARTPAINSPTFVVIREYAGRVPVYNVDAYRLKDSDEFLELGKDDCSAATASPSSNGRSGSPTSCAGPRPIEIVPTGESSREFRGTGLPSP